MLCSADARSDLLATVSDFLAILLSSSTMATDTIRLDIALPDSDLVVAVWRKMRVLSLHTPVRTAANPQFTTFVDNIGEDTTGNRQSLPLLNKTTEIDEARAFLSPSHILADACVCLDRTFLSPRNQLLDNLENQF
ncbi:uncharacterized protein F5147DRAFT_794842 [Suillus discolor]|uniref:Uncharacterized protein n=1 Tax=Suillus discolor TaxID=1912936 RepID=A0A9P7FBH3_9AGAM|nr:uncharacterized protein F5147DRAFT_794842 [Suillus discolor]KAG2111010.1 hypothetical protein F5147DRAFT_794842 [Suillus discolor]